MSATSTSGADGGAVSSASPENPFLPPPALIPLDASDPGLTQAVPFSSGNPRIEETQGVMHLYPSGSASPSNLPVGRKPLVCVLAVPNHMTYADFCQFCGSFIQHMLEMRIVRSDGIEDHYSALIRFDDQESADDFYRHFNGKCFSSLDVSVCNVLFTVDVQYTGSIEHAQSPVASSADQPTCPVCLERLDQDASGILTTICNHSFHCSCISKWTDSSCPVCRYCQQQPEKVSCFVCGVSEDLRMCIICGFVGCEGNNGRHAECHWMEAGHGYALELHSRRVWDYAGQDYVHRLIQSKTDGKLVELHTCCPHEGKTGLKALEEEFDDKIQAIHKEFEELLTSQTLNQRKHYESLILEAEDENEKEISEAIERAASQKLQKLQFKLDKCVKDKKFLDEINENLQKNQEAWKLKIAELEQGEQAAVGLREKRIQALEEQLRGLMLDIETQQAEDESPGSTSTGTKTGAVLVAPTASPTNDGSKHASRNRRRT